MICNVAKDPYQLEQFHSTNFKPVSVSFYMCISGSFFRLLLPEIRPKDHVFFFIS